MLTITMLHVRVNKKIKAQAYRDADRNGRLAPLPVRSEPDSRGGCWTRFGETGEDAKLAEEEAQWRGCFYSRVAFVTETQYLLKRHL